MIKTVPVAATLEGGKVKVGGKEIAGAFVLSEGVGDSAGVLFVYGAQSFYMAKISPDLAETLDRLIAALAQVKTALDHASSGIQSLGTAGFLIGASGAVPSGPVAVSDATAISSASSSINSIKGELQDLMEDLR